MPFGFDCNSNDSLIKTLCSMCTLGWYAINRLAVSEWACAVASDASKEFNSTPFVGPLSKARGSVSSASPVFSSLTLPLLSAFPLLHPLAFMLPFPQDFQCLSCVIPSLCFSSRTSINSCVHFMYITSTEDTCLPMDVLGGCFGFIYSSPHKTIFSAMCLLISLQWARIWWRYQMCILSRTFLAFEDASTQAATCQSLTP